MSGSGAEAGASAPRRRQVRVDESAGRWILLACILASGMALLDSTVVNVALPALGEDLGADLAALQWTVNGYTLTLAALILLGGSLGDRYGRRRVFLVGVAWFAAASLLCGLAPNVEVLVGARVLQGVGGALLTPGSLALIQTAIVARDRARAIGLWSGLGGIAAAVGPFLGGYLVDAVSWRLVFLINVPLAAAVVAVSLRHVPESRDASVQGQRQDVPGAVLGALALAAVTYALIAAGEDGPVRARVWVGAVAGVLAGVAFVVAERRLRHPMLPLGIFSSRQFTAANLVTLAVYAALGGLFFLLVVALQTVLGFSALQAGASLLPITVLMLLLSERSGALASRIGPRRQMAGGPVLAAVGAALLAGLGPGDGYLTAVLPGVVVFGFGLATVVAPLTAAVLAAADQEHVGVASGVNNAAARTAQLLAVAVLPLVAGLSGDDYVDPEAFAEGFRTAALVCSGLLLVGGVLAWLTISDDVLADDEDDEDGAPQREPEPPRWSCPVDGPAPGGSRALPEDAGRAAGEDVAASDR